jgi:Tfp pilus assembly protein PilZ
VSSTKSRKDTRAVVSLVARYRSPATFEYVQEACCDVSVGGMFIKSESPASAGTLLKLECEADEADETNKIRGVGRVVWLRRESTEHGPAGMGVKFVKLEPGSKELITDLVKRLAEAGIEARSISAAPEMTQGLSGGQSQPRALAASKPAAAGVSSTPARSSSPAVTQALAAAAAAASPSSIPTVPRSPMPHVPASFPANAPSTRSSKQDNGHASAASNSSRSQPTSTSTPTSAANGVQAATPAESSLSIAASVVTPIAEPVMRDSAAAAVRSVPPESTVIVDDMRPLDRDSVPPSAARRGSSVRVWIGISVAVCVLLAIIFADDSPQASNTPPDAVSKISRDVPNHAAVIVAAPSDHATKTETPTNAQAGSQTAEVAASSNNAPAAEPSHTAQTAEVTAATKSAQAAALTPTPAQTTAKLPETANSAQAAAPTPAQTTAKLPETTKSAQAAAPVHDRDRLPPPSAADASATSPKPGSAANAAAPAGSQPAKSEARPYVIDFVTRPTGATVSIGELSVVAPGQLKLGTDIPNRLKVVAEKAGCEPSSAWIYRSDFERVEGTFWRRVYMTLPPEAATPPASPAKAK